MPEILNQKQYKVISKMWLSSLIEAVGDSFMDEPGICTRLTPEQIKGICNEIQKIAMSIRGPWPVKREMSDILNYVTRTESTE